MKKIPEKFKKIGFNYELIKREGNVGMYKQLDGKQRIGIEVVVIRLHPKDYARFKIKKGDEFYPSTGEWGKYGWSYGAYTDEQYLQALDAADIKFNEQLKKQNERKTKGRRASDA